MKWSYSKKAKFVFLSCVVLTVFSALLSVDLAVPGSHREPPNPAYHYFFDLKTILVQPVVFTPCMFIMAALLYWAFKSPSNKSNESAKLGLLAMVTCGIVGMIISEFFRR